MKERKKDHWTSKSVAHATITRESRSQSQSHRSGSTPSAVLAVVEDTNWPRPCWSLPFAPSWIVKGSMRNIDGDRTSGRAVGRLFCRAPRDHGHGEMEACKWAIACSCSAVWQWSPFCFQVFSLRMLCFTWTRTQCAFLCSIPPPLGFWSTKKAWLR